MSISQRPFIPIFFLVISGMVLAKFYQSILAGSLLLAMYFLLWLAHEFAGKSRAARYFYIYMFLSSYLLACLISFNPIQAGQNIQLTGKVITQRSLTWYQRVIVYSPELKCRMAVHLSDEFLATPGTWFSFNGSIAKAESGKNPGEFSYADYLINQRVYGVITANEVEMLDKNSFRLSTITQLRDYFAANITDNIASSGLSLALVLGQRTALSEEEQRIWQKLGTNHLLAISGMHIGLLAMVLIKICQLLPGPKLLKNIVIASLLSIYVVISGASPSAWRAWGGTLLSLTAMDQTQLDGLHKWSLVGTVMLLISPNLLWQISFQLSFIASGSIILWAPIFNKIQKLFKENILGKIYSYLVVSLTVSAVAQASLLPCLLYYFQEVALLAPLATLLMVPPIFCLLIGGIMVGLCGAWVKPIGWLMHYITELIGQLNLYLSKFSVVFTNPPLSVGVIVLWYFVFISFGWVFRQHYLFPRKQSNARWLIALLVILFFLSLPAPIKHPLEITVLDVGQGDAIYIRTPAGQHLLIDGGGDSVYWQERGRNVGLSTVVPYLKYRGVEELDLVILSHPHEDHLHGLLAVLENFPIKQVVDNGLPHTTVSYQRYLQLINDQELKYTPVQAGDQLQLRGNLTLTVLHPAQPLQGTSSDHNNNSLVLLLEYQGKKLLFTGDLDWEGQINLLNRGLSQVDWIKVPHHGSRAALYPAFYDALQPKYAVISAGNTAHGHPHQAVVDYLTDENIKVYRTDHEGAISFFVWHGILGRFLNPR